MHPLAQAVNPQTILLSSRALALPVADRTLLLLHELAHLHQLSRPGNDSERALEAEAWEAAHAWATRQPFRIRGRAKGRLNAIAIVDGGPKGHPHAPPWYAIAPMEPIGGKNEIKVASSVKQEKMTLETIFDAIIAAKEKDVILVCHGDPSGLAIPLTEGSSAGANMEMLFTLAADTRFEDQWGMKSPLKSIADVATYASISEARAQNLRAKMNQVRAMKLSHVAFRSCNLGNIGSTKDFATFQAFQRTFGAASLSAPKDFDSYGKFSPSIGPDLAGWATSHRKRGYHIAIVEGVGFGVKDTDSIFAYTIVARSEKKADYNAWVKKHILNREPSPGALIYHGIRMVRPATPTSPAVVFVRDPEFVANLVVYPA